MSTVRSIGEFGLIRQIRKWVPKNRKIKRGIGDDAAVFDAARPDEYQLLTIDTIVEDIDFRKNEATAEQIGWKAMAVNLSDIAAMGGVPKFAVISLTLPKHMAVGFVKSFYRGANQLSRKFHVSIVGGDLSKGKKIIATVALLGEVRKTQVIFRDGAKSGDLICVTGSLGGSIAGKHLTFLPRVREGQLIARFGANALIDISDGLVQDLGHLVAAKQSPQTEKTRLAWRLFERRIPISKDAQRLARGNFKKALDRALYDGEDFELLFAISPAKFGPLEKAWASSFSIPLTVVGEMIRKPKGWKSSYRHSGFRHF